MIDHPWNGLLAAEYEMSSGRKGSGAAKVELAIRPEVTADV